MRCISEFRLGLCSAFVGAVMYPIPYYIEQCNGDTLLYVADLGFGITNNISVSKQLLKQTNVCNMLFLLNSFSNPRHRCWKGRVMVMISHDLYQYIFLIYQPGCFSLNHVTRQLHQLCKCMRVVLPHSLHTNLRNVQRHESYHFWP